MSSRHAVLLTPAVSLRPYRLPCQKQDAQSNFHSPYTLPSSVSSKSCVCHSYENTGGVGVFFPFRNSLVGCRGFNPGNERLSKSFSDYCQLITDHRPLTCHNPWGHCHSCLNSFSCNTYGSPRKCCKQKTCCLSKSFRCNTYKNPRGASTPSTFRRVFEPSPSPDPAGVTAPSQPSPVLSFGRNLELTTYD